MLYDRVSAFPGLARSPCPMLGVLRTSDSVLRPNAVDWPIVAGAVWPAQRSNPSSRLMSVSSSDRPSLTAMLQPRHAQIVERLALAFADSAFELSLVGGVVRDALLGFQINDLDFTTNATPEQIRHIAPRVEASSTYDIGEKFGTIGFVFTGEDDHETLSVEITTYRSEHYPDESRHPQVHFGTDLIEDLARRDFTINAMAVNVMTGELNDPFDGQVDLAMATIRAVGDAEARFEEDPLRLLRAARFVSQLGF